MANTKLTTEQTRALNDARHFGGLSQRSLGGFCQSVEMYPGPDGRASDVSFGFSTVASLVKRGLLVWTSQRHGRSGKWSAKVA